MKRLTVIALSIFVFAAGFVVESIDLTAPAPVVISKAEAYYGQGRRVARRTARRTARRVVRRHNLYRPVRPVAPVVGAGVVAATAIAIGTRVMALPAGCTNVIVNGMTFYNCNGTYYQPVYDGPNVVYVVVNNPY